MTWIRNRHTAEQRINQQATLGPTLFVRIFRASALVPPKKVQKSITLCFTYPKKGDSM